MKAKRKEPERQRNPEDGLPVYKVFQGKVRWLVDERGRLLVQLTTTGEGWIKPPIKFLHHLRMLPEMAKQIGEALIWIGDEAIHERDCKPRGRTDCEHVGHNEEILDARKQARRRAKQATRGSAA